MRKVIHKKMVVSTFQNNPTSRRNNPLKPISDIKLMFPFRSANDGKPSESQLLNGIFARDQLSCDDTHDGKHRKAPVVQLPVPHVLAEVVASGPTCKWV